MSDAVEQALNDRHKARMERKKAIIDEKIKGAQKEIGIVVVNAGSGSGKGKSTTLAPAAYTVRPASGVAGEAVYRSGSLTASFFHACFASCPAAAASLLGGAAA